VAVKQEQEQQQGKEGKEEEEVEEVDVWREGSVGVRLVHASLTPRGSHQGPSKYRAYHSTLRSSRNGSHEGQRSCSGGTESAKHVEYALLSTRQNHASGRQLDHAEERRPE
jgi:hypothetical protein